MDTTFLKNFLTVADTGSIAEAARRLGVTAGAVALQMRVLERELDTVLLARSGRTVKPTEAGHRVLERLRGLVRELDDLAEVAKNEQAAGEFRLGAINSALHSVLPDVLSRFVSAHPNIKVMVQSRTSMELYEGVQRGQYDAAICLHPSFALSKRLDWELVRDEPLVVLAPQRLARRDAHELLRSQPLIRYDRSLGGGKQADQYLHAAGIVPHERFEINSLLAIAMMVERGLGVSLMPDIASPLLSGLRIVRIPLPKKTEPRRFGVLWQRGSTREKLVRNLLGIAHEVARNPRPS
ncbi:LysR family transcriptional regulator [Burkholderia singularis]|uniref:LysR family transcriptional regulator n=1 Tax=Burkholderia singularis TaxID=1503053 RepID=A0A103DXI2_9BURK|nr:MULTISPECIES: LysR family transcriptional regulator [Burkholderia]AOK31877.1 LysR family transcriptional regulator [Burkholderia sp. Bp7605]KVE24537.1 LysR family transcriptional regulator [Burkholderia singularis]